MFSWVSSSVGVSTLAFLVMLAKSFKESICCKALHYSSVHLSSCCFSREAGVDVLKEMEGFFIEELKIFLGTLAHSLVLLLDFLG